MNHTSLSTQMITENNQRILSGFQSQDRYRPVKKTQTREEKPKATKTAATKVSDKTKEFLMAVNLYQYKRTLTEIYSLAGLSAGTGSRMAKDCESKNLITLVQVKFRRGNPRYPILTSQAYEILGIGEKNYSGRGAGQEHTLYQHLIADHFSDHKPVLELNRNNTFIDVAIKRNGLLLCIEVAVTATNEKQNIENDFSKANPDLLIVACKDARVQGQVTNMLSEFSDDIKGKTEVSLISQILAKPPDELINRIEKA